MHNMLSSENAREFQRLQIDHHNAHVAVVQAGPKSSILQISIAVNHLASLLVNAGVSKTMNSGEEIDIRELRKFLKWQAYLIKKLQLEKRSFYYIHREGGDIMLGRTSSLVRDYFTMVDKLINISDSIREMMQQLDMFSRETETN